MGLHSLFDGNSFVFTFPMFVLENKINNWEKFQVFLLSFTNWESLKIFRPVFGKP